MIIYRLTVMYLYYFPSSQNGAAHQFEQILNRYYYYYYGTVLASFCIIPLGIGDCL